MRPIDADELKMESYELELGDNGYYKRVVDVSDIDNAPTIDAIPVVRCENCKHHEDCICVVCEDEHHVVCKRFGKHVKKDWFCADGEWENGDSDG